MADKEIPQDDQQAIANADKPKPTYFFVGSDDKSFVLDQKQAWNELHNKGNWQRNDLRFIGSSDGTTYYRVLKELKVKAKTLRDELAELNVDLVKYEKTEDKFKFEELLDGDDERMVKLNKVLGELRKKVEDKETEYNEVKMNAVNKAFKAEMDEAIKNPSGLPLDQDVTNPRGKDGMTSIVKNG